MNEEDKKRLREKIRVISGDTSDELDDPKYNYIVYRTVKVIEHAIKEGSKTSSLCPTVPPSSARLAV